MEGGAERGGGWRVLELLPVIEVEQVVRAAEWDFERNKMVSRFRDGKPEGAEEDVFVVSMEWGRSYVFKAQSAEEGKVWVRCIDTARKHAAAQRASSNARASPPSGLALSPDPTGRTRVQQKLQDFVDSQAHIIAVACIALINVACNLVLLQVNAPGADGVDGGGGDGGGWGGVGPEVVYVNMAFGILVLVDLVLAMVAYGRKFVTRPWLLLDLALALVVLVCDLCVAGALGRGLVTCLSVRVARVLELGRLSGRSGYVVPWVLPWLEPLKRLGRSLSDARHTLLSTVALLVLLSLAYAVAGVALFGRHDPVRFGSVGKAVGTFLLASSNVPSPRSSPAPASAQTAAGARQTGRGAGAGGVRQRWGSPSKRQGFESDVVAARRTWVWRGAAGGVERGLRAAARQQVDSGGDGLEVAVGLLVVSYVVLCVVVAMHLLVVMIAQHQKGSGQAGAAATEGRGRAAAVEDLVGSGGAEVVEGQGGDSEKNRLALEGRWWCGSVGGVEGLSGGVEGGTNVVVCREDGCVYAASALDTLLHVLAIEYSCDVGLAEQLDFLFDFCDSDSKQLITLDDFRVGLERLPVTSKVKLSADEFNRLFCVPVGHNGLLGCRGAVEYAGRLQSFPDEGVTKPKFVSVLRQQVYILVQRYLMHSLVGCVSGAGACLANPFGGGEWKEGDGRGSHAATMAQLLASKLCIGLAADLRGVFLDISPPALAPVHTTSPSAPAVSASGAAVNSACGDLKGSHGLHRMVSSVAEQQGLAGDRERERDGASNSKDGAASSRLLEVSYLQLEEGGNGAPGACTRSEGGGSKRGQGAMLPSDASVDASVPPLADAVGYDPNSDGAIDTEAGETGSMAGLEDGEGSMSGEVQRSENEGERIALRAGEEKRRDVGEDLALVSEEECRANWPSNDGSREGTSDLVTPSAHVHAHAPQDNPMHTPTECKRSLNTDTQDTQEQNPLATPSSSDASSLADSPARDAPLRTHSIENTFYREHTPVNATNSVHAEDYHILEVGGSVRGRARVGVEAGAKQRERESYAGEERGNERGLRRAGAGR